MSKEKPRRRSAIEIAVSGHYTGIEFSRVTEVPYPVVLAGIRAGNIAAERVGKCFHIPLSEKPRIEAEARAISA